MISTLIRLGRSALFLIPLILVVFGWGWNSPDMFFCRANPAYGAPATPAGEKPSKQGRMTTGDEIAGRFLNLSANEYFGQTPDFTNREFSLLSQKFEGLAINAPVSVDVTTQTGLPVVLASVETTRRQWEVYKQKNLMLLALSIDSGTVYVGPAYPPPGKMPAREVFSRQPPEPRETPPYSRNAKIELLQGRERLNLPWQSGRFRLAAVNFDWVSNTVEVELKGKGPPEEGKPRKVHPEPASRQSGQGTVLPCYEALSTTPKLSREGLNFQIQSEKTASDSLPVFGTFTAGARQWYLDRTGTVHTGIGGKKMPVTAVVPVTLLVFGLDMNAPMRFEWGVPVYAEASGKKDKLTGFFAVDALKDGNVKLSPGKYVAYISCDARLHGPKEFSVGSR